MLHAEYGMGVALDGMPFALSHAVQFLRRNGMVDSEPVHGVGREIKFDAISHFPACTDTCRPITMVKGVFGVRWPSGVGASTSSSCADENRNPR